MPAVTRILIVDDDPALLQALPETLRLRIDGAVVDTADSAAAALERIRAVDYDAVVTDIKMPGMDGLALLNEIRSLRPETPTLIQALQVIISPFPGEITGPVGGALFGTTWGLVYSTIGLTLGTLSCFAIGRLWGEPLVRPWLSEHHWNRLNFIVEAEGAIICFILYLTPGFPKDIISYLFGISPIPFWLFAVVSTLGRLPGTWVSSYFGAHVAEQQYIYAIAFLALVVALCLPIYYYRDRILRSLHRKRPKPPEDLDERFRRGLE